METNLLLGIFIVILIFFSAIFSSMETAFSSSSIARLKAFESDGIKNASTALKIIENYDKALTTILIGNNIVNITCSSLSTILFMNLFKNYGAAISTGVITLLVLMFGEIMPKSLAKNNSEKFCLAFAPFLNFLMTILTPLSYIFMAIKTLTVKISNSENTDTPSVTENELKYIIESIEEEGVLEEQESELVNAALDFDEKTVQEVLTPRVDVTAIDIDDSYEENKEIILRERFSRIPVYKDSIDNIIGILHSRDFLDIIARGGTPDISKLIQPAYFIYKTRKLSTILSEFKRKRLHIAIVTDEYGGTSGIVTMEDLLEEIVGDIWDEDEEEEKNFIKVGENCYKISGDTDIDELAEFLDIDKKKFETDCNSVGGWIFETLGYIPKSGEKFTFDSLEVTVKTVTEQRITDVVIKKIEKQVTEQTNKKN